ncbi:lipid II flippase MurJ [Clostridium sartagoforme]|uniref:lipid II flippase MurJ n=1 Tax=Clostridium sartagoforme TaxID=84031 RepID=UPI0003A2B83B|nr:lipid II flippase MurJ [Clostridium sartagoforme]
MNSRFLKVSIIFTFLTLVGKILSFLKEMIIASQFGISAQTDAFNLALSIPNILYSVCASAILITFIPNFYEVEKEDGLDGAYNFSNVFLTFLLLINSSVLIICNLFSEEIVKMIGPGLDYETQVLANSLIKVSLFNLMFMVISSVYSAILRSKEKFIGVSLMVIITNIPLIIMLTIFKYKISIEVVNFLTTIGFCLQFVILLPEMRKIKYKFEFIFNGYKKEFLYDKSNDTNNHWFICSTNKSSGR